MKQTAVDYLFKKMDVFGFSDISTSVTASKEVWEQIYKEAKQREKEQIEEAFIKGEENIDINGCYENPNLSELYYQETYGKDA